MKPPSRNPRHANAPETPPAARPLAYSLACSLGLTRRDTLGLMLGSPLLLRAQSPLTDAQRRTLLYGGGLPPSRAVELRAGPVTLLFEPETGNVRNLVVGDTEVVHGIYAAVRDHNWGTVTPQIQELRMEQQEHNFAVSFTALCQSGPIDFLWNASLTGDAAGTVRYTFDGSARSAFRRNRVGFCVLHPAAMAGSPVRLEHADGGFSEATFPTLIAPHQPFTNLRAFHHALPGDVQAEIRMTGDVFETEDQRNWSDASFKTYCTPLSLPFPVALRAGDRIQQAVVLTVKGAPGSPRLSLRPPTVDLAVDASRAFLLPAFGLNVSSVTESLSPREAALLQRLQLSHLRAAIRFADASPLRALSRGAAQARLLETSLELAVHLEDDPEAELRFLAEALRSPGEASGAHPALVARFLVFRRGEPATSAATLTLAQRILTPVAPQVAICGGTDGFFTELNRNRPGADVAAGFAYSINPQVHAFDNLSLVETLPMHAETLTSARAFCGSAPLHVTPITLKPRFLPAATAPELAHTGPLRDLPAAVDPRQPSLFAAAWTAGSLMHLAAGGAASATFFETVGWLGVLESSQGSPLPAKFPSAPGAAFPVYHVFAAAAPFRGGELLPVGSSQPLDVVACVLRKGRRHRLLAANLTDRPQVVRISGIDWASAVRVHTLDEHSAALAAADPTLFWAAADAASAADSAIPGPGSLYELSHSTLSLPLLPYALTFVDS